MKKIGFLTIAASVMLLSFKALEPSTWSLDKGHAKLGFSISHMMISEVEGNFKNFDATINATKEDFSDAVVTMTADVNSINTDNEKRDGHLKSPDFFDAAKFPNISFKSTSFKKVDATNYKVTGDLTMHGVTKAVELNAMAKTGMNPMSKKMVGGFKITGKIKRADFNLGASMPAAMLGEEVEILANAEFAKN